MAVTTGVFTGVYTMTEWRIILLLTAGSFLWMAGGTWHKAYRRILWPIIAGLTLWQAISNPLFTMLVVLSLFATTILPYGDRTPWLVKSLVFASYGLPVCWLDWQFGLWWALGCGIVLTCLMVLSQRVNWLTHKVTFEFPAGALQAAGLVLGALR